VQSFPFCAASPEQAYFGVSVAGLPDGTVELKAGGVVVGGFEIAQGQAPGLVSIDARGLFEGRVPMEARHQDGRLIPIAGPVEDSDVERWDFGKAPFIDKTPQAVDILAPAEMGRVCVSRDSAGRDTVRIGLRAIELGKSIELSEAAQYRRGDGPWEALPVVSPTRPLRLPTGETTGFLWNVTGLTEGEYTLRLPTCDRAGHTAVDERRLSIARTPPLLSIAVERTVFSPNGDGRADTFTATATLTQPLRLTVEVRRETMEGAIVRRLVTDQPYEPGSPVFAWDGRDDASQPVADGVYVIVVRGRDECAVTAQEHWNVQVDTQPPVASIAAPTPSQTIVAGVDVRGIADDPRFRSFELAFGIGPAPESWTVFSTSSTPAPAPGGRLGRWNAPAEEGVYVLRLQATDHAENAATALVAVTVAEPTLIDRLTVTPPAFSPNGDGRLETATVEYVLRAPATVRLEVRGTGGAVLRTLVPGVQQPAGLHSVGWDGAADGGAPAPEGEHQVHITAEAAPLEQETSAALVLDRTPPQVSVTSPAPGAFVTPQGSVRGSVLDPRLSSFVVRAQPPSGPAVEIGRGASEVSNGELASLAPLQDGAHQLAVTAEDAAANRTSAEVDVTVDGVAPVASLLPLGAVVHRGSAPIDVTGTAADANLREYVLAFGAGAQPSTFVEIARAAGAVQGASLGQWTVAALPDGTYTLRLVVTDKAGQAAEARLTLVLDGTDPVASLAAPAEGARINAEAEVRGSAEDANFDAWTLEMAPGPASQAQQWTLVATGEAPVSAGVLGSVAPLPPDGTHTLRLTVRDAASHGVAVLRSFKVDTVPPAAPGGLRAEVTRNGAAADVRLRWDAVSDGDLAGYVVRRDGAPLTPDPIAATQYVDAGRGDGRYPYEVLAVDAAGNAGPASAIAVRVDLTPPIVDITAPRAGDALSGSVDVRGSAFSADDFREYRLLAGAGAAPSSWTLLERSSLPVAAASLGAWEALGAGPYVLALEADDDTGNTARVTVAVAVDNVAPTAPVLATLVNAPSSDALTATWHASPEPDVRGYLLYRNGLLANADGVVVGDLRPYLLPGPSYVDAALPDGEHCYRVVAMDQAGNLSPPSNPLCQALDNRRPQAVIVEPPDGTRFEFPLHVLADTPDRDVQQAQFQVKPAAESTWQALGAADTQAPFEVTLDPAALAPGAYDLRALARDAAGEDPGPASIRVVYGDTTAPAAPQGLVARVDGRAVSLAWSPNAEADLAGYHVWRGVERITEAPVSSTSFVDTVAAPGAYTYRVTAVDADANESAPSAAADALVYVLQLLPAFPVMLDSSVALPGDGALEDTAIEVRRDGSVIAQVNAAAAGAFTVPAVPLVAGANVLTAQAADAAGNRSIPSDEAVLILNAPPPAVADVEAAVDGHTVDLTWPAVTAPDLFEYAVARGATDLTPPVPQTDHASVSASSSAGPGFEPERALDSDPGTSWIPDPDVPSATWTVTFPEAVLLRRVALTFPDAVPDYRIEARWEGRYLPLVRVHGNTEISVEHLLPSSFATDAVRVAMSGPVLGLAEVSIERRALAAAPAFQDPHAPDGTHEYAVRAVDRYGAEGEAAVRTVDVGDVTPPAAPAGVNALVSGADVLLAWTASPEADLSHYVLLREGTPIATSVAPGYLDAGLPNGTYRYAVVAVDAAGNRSGPSAEVTATVAVAPPVAPVLNASALPNGSVALAWTHAGAAAYVVHRAGVSGGPYTVVGQTGDTRAFIDPTAPRGAPQFYRVHAVDAHGNPSALSNEAAATPERTEAPAAPVVLVPTDADHPATVFYTDATIEGRAEAHSLVSVEANGTLRGVVEAGDPFAQAASGGLNHGAARPVLSADGRRMAFAVVNPLPAVLWRDLATQFSGAVTHPGSDTLLAQAFSPDGARLAYRMQACDGGGACRSDLFVADLGGGGTETIEDGEGDVVDAAWSPDGARLAFTTATETTCALWVHELDPPATRPVFSAGECGRPRFAPDSARAALAARAEGEPVWRLLVVDLDPPASSVIAEGVWPQTVPSWSHDGTRVAFTSAASAALRARIHDLAAGTTADVTDPQLPSFDPQLDPQGGWISFTAMRSTADGPVRDLVAEDLARGGRRTVATWPGGAEAGPIALHAWAAHHTLAAAFPDRVALFAAEGQFRLDGLRLTAGENVVLARATDPGEGLTSADSRPIRLTVPDSLFTNLTLANDGLSTYPAMPQAGQGTLLKARVANAGAAPAFDVPVVLTVRDAAGVTRHEQEVRLSQLETGQAAWVTSLWTPAAEGSYGFRTVADPQDAIAESREDDNRADLGVLVAPPGGLGVRVTSDRAEYAVNAPALLSVRLTNGGAAFSGEVRTTVEAGPATVAVVDSRQVTLAYGQSLDFTLGWNTGLTYAGDYAFVARAAAPAGAVHSAQPFRILPDVNVSARILPGAASVPQGQPATFTARVGNDGLNAPLDGASARLRVLLAGAPEPVFIATAPLPRILPGGSWEGALAWPSAQPAGDYVAELEVLAPAPLASASAPFRVVAPPGSVVGTLSVAAHALRGEGALAQATVTNTGTAPLLAKAFAVEVASGETGEVLVRAPFTLDLPPGETRAATVTVPTATLPAGAYPVFLRAAAPPLTLDRRTLNVHGPIGAPSVDSPVPGARVPTSHPTLVVGNAAAPPGTAVTYEFEVFADAALTQPLPGARGVAETPERTGWRVQVNLTEDRTFYWRARAGDGTAVSPWSGVGSFTVDETNQPPSAPVPDTPPPGARVASREPLLTVKNALELDLDPLTYDFRVAEDAGMSTVVTSVADLPEGLGLTSWRVPVTLAENQAYFWSARARDPRDVSPWSEPISFIVDTVDESPTAPEPLRPVGGATTPTLQPELAVSNAFDPERQPLTYHFEVDVVPSFDSPGLQVSGAVPEGLGETAWVPVEPLADNTLHFWRSAASDGHSSGPFAGSTFFVNVANDPPGAPVPLSPTGGIAVGTRTPELRVQNAVDLDGDALTYEFEVTDESGANVVAGVAGVGETSPVTSWAVTPPLAEDASFLWRARASDGAAAGPWSAPQAFRVNAIADPPTAPELVSPPEGAVLDQPRPALVVANATSPDGLVLTYAFELYSVASNGTVTLRESATGVPEGVGTTSFTPAADLPDGAYRWRSRASDATQDGPWMSVASFTVAVDRPPSAPAGVTAVPGDGTVTLSWNVNPEADVVAYRVYRASASGGPYTLRATVTALGFTDGGLANGVTVYYVVTALDARFESARSGEVAATPRPPVMPAAIRFDPAVIDAECLLGGSCWASVALDGGECCPRWLYATIELPPGHSPSQIDRAGVRLGGSAAPDPGYWKIVDDDHDGIPELELRFGREKLPPLLVPGNNTVTVSGWVSGAEFRGSAVMRVNAFDVELKITPSTLKKTSNGNDVEAHLTFEDCVRASSVSVASLRLNGVVPVKNVVSTHGSKITVKFDRAAVAALLPVGDHVQVRVTGTLSGLPFQAVDYIRVIP
jgi:fibronectin type 3 domain-containing protein/flagellar hook assembly protein FlgD